MQRWMRPFNVEDASAWSEADLHARLLSEAHRAFRSGEWSGIAGVPVWQKWKIRTHPAACRWITSSRISGR